MIIRTDKGIFEVSAILVEHGKIVMETPDKIKHPLPAVSDIDQFMSLTALTTGAIDMRTPRKVVAVEPAVTVITEKPKRTRK